MLKMYKWKSVSGDGDAFRVWKTEKICFNCIKFHLTGLTDCVIVKNALLWQQVPLSLYALIFRRGQERPGTLYLFTNSKSQEVNRQWRKTGYVRSAAEEVYE